MESLLYIENLKCGGCAATITKELSAIAQVEEITVDVEKSLVTVQSTEEAVGVVKEKLAKLGYPEVGDKNTLLHKAKSFVSCATGRINS